MTDEEVITGYLAHVEDASAADNFWAWEAVTDLVASDPERAWGLLLSSLERCHGTESMIGAGPLEELLIKHPRRFASRVAQELLTNPRFGRAYDAIYFSDASPEDADFFDETLRAAGVPEERLPTWL